MKTKDLIRILQTLDQNKPIFLSGDSEGNDYFCIDIIDTTLANCYILWPDDSEPLTYEDLRNAKY